MPELEVKETTSGAIGRSSYRAERLPCRDSCTSRDGYAAEVGIDGEVVPVTQDDGRSVAWDQEDPADNTREDRIGSAVAIEPEVHPTAIDLDTTMLAVLMHTESAENRVRATYRSGKATFILLKG